jgi:hypothetical protein
MQRKFLVIVPIVVIGIFGYAWFANRKSAPPVVGNVPALTQTENALTYTNNDYGFSFSLPEGWRGYAVVVSAWEGSTIGEKGDTPAAKGPLLLIRNPKWTVENKYQDIPIMVFTLAEWDQLQHDEFHIGAAPINPSELGRNARHVFALPARYNYAFPLGYEEVEQILAAHPLRVF